MTILGPTNTPQPLHVFITEATTMQAAWPSVRITTTDAAGVTMQITTDHRHRLTTLARACHLRIAGDGRYHADVTDPAQTRPDPKRRIRIECVDRPARAYLTAVAETLLRWDDDTRRGGHLPGLPHANLQSLTTAHERDHASLTLARHAERLMDHGPWGSDLTSSSELTDTLAVQLEAGLGTTTPDRAAYRTVAAQALSRLDLLDAARCEVALARHIDAPPRR